MVRLIVDANLYALVDPFILHAAHTNVSLGRFHWTTIDWGHVWSLLPEGADWILSAEPIIVVERHHDTESDESDNSKGGKGGKGKGGGKGVNGKG
jgi:hypothetical protein